MSKHIVEIKNYSNANIYPPGMLQKYTHSKNLPSAPAYKAERDGDVGQRDIQCHHSLTNQWEVLLYLVDLLPPTHALLSMSPPRESVQDLKVQ